ncbi:MAG: hypothetical protein JWP97_53 [Labilithrix sp.]|nr:hypothetical protein [Labilithrix sp.]
MSARAAIVGILCAASSLGAVACNKIPGLGKGDGAEGGSAQAAGGLSFGGGAFEGELTMNVVNQGGNKPQPMTLVLASKSPKVRVDVTSTGSAVNPMLAGGGSFLIDVPAKKGYMLMASQKKAMVLDFEQMKAQQKALGAHARNGGAPADEGPPQIEKTGKKEVVAGYTCEDWKVTTKTLRSEMCVAEGLQILDLGDLGVGSPELVLAAAGGANHFPLRAVSYNAQNVEQTRMEVTKVDPKTLDAARFVVPADYQVLDLSSMLGGLGGMGAPGGPGRMPPGVPPGFTTPPASKPH